MKTPERRRRRKKKKRKRKKRHRERAPAVLTVFWKLSKHFWGVMFIFFVTLVS